MTMLPVKSSAVTSVGYDTATKELRVKFTHGGLYAYYGILPPVFKALLAAPSIGRAVRALGLGKKIASAA